jgi:hypothetical protein
VHSKTTVTWAALAVLGATICCSSGSPGIVTSALGALDPSSGWPGCTGTFDTQASPTGAYFVTDFGCSSSPQFTDSSDNCCPSGVVEAASDGLCAAGTTTAGCTDDVGTSAAIACERAVNWFSTGGSTYGLGTRLRLTRSDTGVSVVVFVIDNGPACYREQQFGGYALDISYPAIQALYGGEEGVSDRATVAVTVVSPSTPLGIVSGPAGTDAGAPTTTADAGGEAARSGGEGSDGGGASEDSDGGGASEDSDGGATEDSDGGATEDSSSEDSDSGFSSEDSDGASQDGGY